MSVVRLSPQEVHDMAFMNKLWYSPIAHSEQFTELSKKPGRHTDSINRVLKVRSLTNI